MAGAGLHLALELRRLPHDGAQAIARVLRLQRCQALVEAAPQCVQRLRITGTGLAKRVHEGAIVLRGEDDGFGFFVIGHHHPALAADGLHHAAPSELLHIGSRSAGKIFDGEDAAVRGHDALR